MLNALIKSKFNVTVIVRASTAATFPDSVNVVTVDYSSVDSVTEALKGQDAVVSTVGTPGILGQNLFIGAAVAAGVKRFLPSDFGCDLGNPLTGALPVYKNKKAIHKKLQDAAAANPDFTYTLVCNNAFLDFGIKAQTILSWKEGKPKFYDGGNAVFSATTLDSVGEAVAGVLNHPEETRNRFVYIKDIDITQSKLLEIAKRVDPARTWEEPQHFSTAEMEKVSNESLAKGVITPQVMGAYILRVLFGPPEYHSLYEEVDNELLGLKGKTEAEVEAVVKGIMLG